VSIGQATSVWQAIEKGAHVSTQSAAACDFERDEFCRILADRHAANDFNHDTRELSEFLFRCIEASRFETIAWCLDEAKRSNMKDAFDAVERLVEYHTTNREIPATDGRGVLRATLMAVPTLRLVPTEISNLRAQVPDLKTLLSGDYGDASAIIPVLAHESDE
jgi:hypothetical protein